ncbi:MAG: glycosyltransferase family 2 protein [Terriglobales bacterium]
MVAPDSKNAPLVSVIVPARNEEVCLGACLDSLLAQTGVEFEIIVVDDGSTDRTRQIAESILCASNLRGQDPRSGPGRVIDAGRLAEGCSGKCNAAQSGANAARGEWLLFTDADTVHLPGSLERSLVEARRHQVALLSYSPAQEVHGILENAVMPVIYAELAAQYRPRQVCDPASPVAAANGQYLLITREAYDAVGGHAAVSHTLLEDVALARAVKRSGRRLRFRFGGDAVRTRMYRTWPDLRDGWTKNLALLFPGASRLAARRGIEFLLAAGGLGAAVAGLATRRYRLLGAGLAVAVPTTTLFFRRVRRAHFGPLGTTLSPLGLPLFVLLLLRSQLHYGRGKVSWKGRIYRHAIEREGTAEYNKREAGWFADQRRF